jgi:hypothetical protein
MCMRVGVWCRVHLLARSLGYLAVLGMLLTGCGDPPIATSSDVNADVAKLDVKKTDALGDAADDAEDDVATDDDAAIVEDVADAGSDAGQDVPLSDGVFIFDGGPNEDSGPIGEDVACGEGKVTDFHIVTTDPPAGTADVANPFTFTVTFNTKVKAVVIGPNTVQVVVNGAIIDGTYSVACNSFTFKASAPVLQASRVDVTLSPLVQAEIGYNLPNEQSFHFYVHGFDGMAPYEKLARRYAPTLRQAVASGNDKYDQLRAFDYDGDWQAGNNGVNFSKSPAIGQVGWSVIETQSHFFITYVYFWPHRTGVLAGVAFDNDAAGAIVTVARWPTEHPVAVSTWFKQKSMEEMWTWITSESGIPKTGYVRGVLPQATLFPPAKDGWGCEGIVGCKPQRYPAFLTSGNHQSCLWLDAGDSLNCTNNASTQATLKWIDYAPGATPTEPTAADSPGPMATYGLTSTFETWWPRRQDVGTDGMWHDATFTYAPPTGRPAGVKMVVGGKFYNKDADASRPPWAWSWKGATPDGLPTGTEVLDTAYAESKHFEDTKNPLGAFDAVKKTGWSQDYCFNPYLYIDLRVSANCLKSLP